MVDSISTALRGLTGRGRSFGVLGVGVLVVGLGTGQRDLLRIGVLLLALPMLALGAVLRTRFLLTCQRRTEPDRVEVGEDTTVVLRLDNVARLPTGVLLLEDSLPWALGSRPRFTLDRIEPRGVREVGYPLRSDLRGRFALGPLTVRVTDPFGLVELPRTFTGTDMLTVHPTVVDLPSVLPGATWSGAGDTRQRVLASQGSDDAGVREYRTGDDLRRVHWRTSAHRGSLMVRQEEQPLRNTATVLLDTRARAHRGDGPTGSFEWAVTAVASIGAHLIGQGFRVQLEAGGPFTDALDAGSYPLESDAGAWLDALATVGPSKVPDLAASLQVVRRRSPALVVAVVGALYQADLEELAALGRGGSRCVVVALDTTSWAASSWALETSACVRVLQHAGWTGVPALAGDRVDEVWRRLRLPDPVGAR